MQTINKKPPKLYKNSINRVLPCQIQIKKVKIEPV